MPTRWMSCAAPRSPNTSTAVRHFLDNSWKFVHRVYSLRQFPAGLADNGMVQRGVPGSDHRAVLERGPERVETDHGSGTHVVVTFSLDGIEIGRMDQGKPHRITSSGSSAGRAYPTAGRRSRPRMRSPVRRDGVRTGAFDRTRRVTGGG